MAPALGEETRTQGDGWNRADFPLRVSPSGRYLEDSQGRPFLYQADTAWMLFFRLGLPEAIEYLKARKNQGFNVIQVQLTGFLGMGTVEGEMPFAGPDYDFSTPNEAFFRHVDQVVDEAGKLGLALAMTPAWVGCCGEGWGGKTKAGQTAPLGVNGPAKCFAFGQWLGTRYRDRAHVLWIHGGDNDPGDREEIRQLALGIRDRSPHQLMTYHAASTHCSTDVWPPAESWLDVSMVYTYFRGFNKAWRKDQPDVYEVSLAEYRKQPVRPFFLGESTYEGEHGEWGSALQARKQAWWCVLSGGCGHAYGSPNWNFPENWREVLQLPGAGQMQHLRRFLEARNWHQLVPDLERKLVPAPESLPPNRGHAAAIARDGMEGLVYYAEATPRLIDPGCLAGSRIRFAWFNPRSGETGPFQPWAEGGSGRRELKPPGDGDWFLVVQAS